MIAHLKGTVIHRLEKEIIVSTGGVGYLVNAGNDLLSSVTQGKEVELFIYTQVKEDALTLYGFVEMSQMQFFKQLISVSGIGAKTAMGILDMPVSLTQRAIHEEDISYLSQAPGLGKKTAARLVLELKGKIEISMDVAEESSAIPRSLQEEALQALESLGYDKPSIIRFMNKTDESYDSAEELVRGFLQHA
jgi:Holliday junction DNA helicase RuvA